MEAERNEANEGSGFRSIGRALKHRNYRLFFGGQGISLIGTWMTRIATYWLVYRISPPHEAAYWLGIVGFAGLIPAFFLGPIAGVLVDRWNRHRLLVVTQALSLVQSALMAAVAFGGQAGPAVIAQVIALSAFQGLINAFDMPGRQSFLIEMVTRREDLANAIALNSSLVNGAQLVGPSLAGALIAVASEGWCFTVDAVSYLAVIASLLVMRVPPRAEHPRHAHVWRDIWEGFVYSFGFAPIREILLLLALVSFMGVPYRALMPIFAEDILKGGPYLFGFLTAASGVGALLGALYLASRRTVLGLGRTIALAAATFGVGLMGFALSQSVWISLSMMVLTGLGMMVEMAASNTILQTIVEEDKRGRVMSFYSMAFMGAAPFGNLFAGFLAHVIGAPATVLIGGAACLLGALLFALRLPRLRPLVRPIYIKMGILPEVAAGIQSATELTRTSQE